MSIDVVRAFNRSLRVNYPIVQTTADIDAVTGQVLALPTTWLIDRAGRVVSTHVGEIDPAHVEREVQALIAASGGSLSRAPSRRSSVAGFLCRFGQQLMQDTQVPI